MYSNDLFEIFYSIMCNGRIGRYRNVTKRWKCLVQILHLKGFGNIIYTFSYYVHMEITFFIFGLKYRWILSVRVPTYVLLFVTKYYWDFKMANSLKTSAWNSSIKA